LSEKITVAYSYVIIIAFQIIGLLVVVFSGNQAVTRFGLMTFVLGMGGVGALGPLVVAETFGLKNLGSILGLMSFAVIIPTAVDPILSGQVFDHTGQRDVAFLATCAFLAVALVLFFAAAYLNPRPTTVRAA
jgi:MFS family permease